MCLTPAVAVVSAGLAVVAAALDGEIAGQCDDERGRSPAPPVRDRIPHHDNRLLLWFKRLYEPAFKWAVDRPGKVIGVAVALLVAAMFLGSRLGTEFLPELDEGSIWVNVSLPPSVSQTEAKLAARRIAQRARGQYRGFQIRASG